MSDNRTIVLTEKPSRAAPDGSQYQGTLTQDYWTFSPTFEIAYLSKDWHLSMNVEYDFHTL